jgi:hypothetical protein
LATLQNLISQVSQFLRARQILESLKKCDDPYDAKIFERHKSRLLFEQANLDIDYGELQIILKEEFASKQDTPEFEFALSLIDLMHILKTDEVWSESIAEIDFNVEDCRVIVASLFFGHQDVEDRDDANLLIMLGGNPDRIEQIITEQTDRWEWLLLDELLRPALNRIRDTYSDLQQDLYPIEQRAVTGHEFLSEIEGLMTRLESLVSTLNTLINEDLSMVLNAVPPFNEPSKIMRACVRLIGICEGFLDCEIGLHTLEPPHQFSYLHKLLTGFTVKVFEEVASLPNQLMKKIKEKSRLNDLEITLNLELSIDSNAVTEEMRKLGDDKTWQE